MYNIALIDADLLDGGTRFPNLALMKISGYFKERGGIELVESYENFNPNKFDKIYISKVFDFTKIDESLLTLPNVYYGGTGFFFDKATPLPYEIEHHMPDYHLYDEYIAHDTKHTKKSYWKEYGNYSIGFATRGCFRQCKFCVNQNYKKVEFNAHISEFYDPETKGIILLDDNIFGYNRWKDVFDELAETNKPFIFKQGMDIRLLNDLKAQVLAKCKYMNEFIFAFDNVDDEVIITRKLELLRKYTSRNTKLYVLCGFKGQGGDEIDGIFKRIEILSKYKCLPYIMRHKNYLGTPYEGMFKLIARWCNQPNLFKKLSLYEFVSADEKNIKTKDYVCSSRRYIQKFENDYPEIAKKWFNKRFWTGAENAQI